MSSFAVTDISRTLWWDRSPVSSTFWSVVFSFPSLVFTAGLCEVKCQRSASCVAHLPFTDLTCQWCCFCHAQGLIAVKRTVRFKLHLNLTTQSSRCCFTFKGKKIRLSIQTWAATSKLVETKEGWKEALKVYCENSSPLILSSTD